MVGICWLKSQSNKRVVYSVQPVYFSSHNNCSDRIRENDIEKKPKTEQEKKIGLGVVRFHWAFFANS